MATRDGSGSGEGSGWGAGEGSGWGSGWGSGAGAGEGSGWGWGSGAGEGSGDGAGEGSGWGSGSGEGWSSGSGSGWGSGSGSGWGSGAGSGWGSGAGAGEGSGEGSGAGEGWGSGSGEGWSSGSGEGWSSGAGWGSGSGSGEGEGWGEGDLSEMIPVYLARLPRAVQDRAVQLERDGATLAYWRSSTDGRPCNGGSGEPVYPGLIQTAPGPLDLCCAGTFHATLCPVGTWKGPRVWIVALIGKVARDGNKLGALQREILGEVTYPDDDRGRGGERREKP